MSGMQPPQARNASFENLAQYDVLILDMNDTFMFGGDRFSDAENYFATYSQLGGGGLTAVQVHQAIRTTYEEMSAIYVRADRHDSFPQVAEVVQQFFDFPATEVDLLSRVFAVHELGTVPQQQVSCIRKLSETHELHILSNLWSAKDPWLDCLRDLGILDCFESLVFSSDGSSVKPSSKIFAEMMQTIGSKSALMVGDSLRCDVAGAQQAGIDSLWISPSQADETNGPVPKFVATSLIDLLQKDDERTCKIGGSVIRVVRSLSDVQIDQLLELYQIEWPDESQTRADMVQAVDGSSFVIGLTDIATTELVGFCRVLSDGGLNAWILGVVVRSDYRGTGLGRLLMDEVLGAEELRGVHSVGLTCAPKMIPFYEQWASS